MSFFLLSKGTDIHTWRAAEEFGAAFHKELRNLTANLSSDQSLALFDNVGQELERLAAYYDEQWNRMRKIVDQAAETTEADRLKELAAKFYDLAYSVFGRSSSAPAFFQMSHSFLRAVSGSIVAHAKAVLGDIADRLPPIALIALGPAGRHEFSPFCRLQLLLVHNEIEPALVEPLRLMCVMLHQGFESVGFLVDEVITPRNGQWRGNMIQWQQRLNKGLEGGVETEAIDVIRLADQTTLFADSRIKNDFRAATRSFLIKNRHALTFMVNRLHGLSNGIGLMGGLRLEKSGPFRGSFALLDHALLPLTASITALYMLGEGSAAATTARIRELISRQDLNVKYGETVLQAWHSLQELRLLGELKLYPDINRADSLYVDPETLSGADTEQLREALETVAALQRQVFLSFNAWLEQSEC